MDRDPREWICASQSFELEMLAKEELILEASENANSNRAFESAIKHFTEHFGGRLPCTAEQLKSYLVRYAGECSIATLEQRRALIGRWHREHGFSHNPNDSESVRTIMRGIRKRYGTKPKQAKPVSIQVVERVIAHLDGIAVEGEGSGSSVLRAVRDKAMWLTAFWFGLRSSELIQIRACDLEFHWQAESPYFELYLLKSKTDRQGKGVTKRLERLPQLCPMEALREWMEISCAGVDSQSFNQSETALFTKVSRWGERSDQGIHINSINKLFKQRLREAGIDPQFYSTHSLRRGIANWIIDSGASVAELKEWVGWQDTRTAMRYLQGRSSLPSQIIQKQLKSGIEPVGEAAFIREPRLLESEPVGSSE